MSPSRTQILSNRKRRIQNRLRDRKWASQDHPMFTASHIRYELAEKTRGLSAGGIGLIHSLARQSGLIEAIDRRLHLLKVHKPYHESDHVLNIAYNLLAGGDCLEDLELLRNDEVYLDALGAQRIPDPTTAGDFCRRFEAADVHTLMRMINDVRVRMWRSQPRRFFRRAILDGDGTLAPTLAGEDVAEFSYRPTACKKLYRLVVVRKNLSVAKGEQVLFDDVRYFFYISNSWAETAEELVFLANDRCNQENLIEQLKNGVHALDLPVDNLVSNWAYMVMGALAWSLKAWLALSLPENGRWAEKHKTEKQSVLKMEFKRFVNAFLRVPCQIVRQARRITYPLLAWNPWQHVFLRAVDNLRRPMRC